jgi:hypothetical protein
MPHHFIDIHGKDSSPSYVDWRGELLTKLALARIPGLIVNQRPARPDVDPGYDFLVATEKGFCFFVQMKAFSSSRRSIGRGANQEWPWSLESSVIRRARESRSPFLLFLFDADSEEGRFLRLDTLPMPNDESSTMMIRLSKENTINKESLEQWIAAAEQTRVS